MFDDLKQGQQKTNTDLPASASVNNEPIAEPNSKQAMDQAAKQASNGPAKIDDMFADVDPVNDSQSNIGSGKEPLSGVQAGKIKPISNTPQTPRTPSVDDMMVKDSRDNKGKGKTIVLIIILFLVAAGAGYYFFVYKPSTENLNIINADLNANINLNANLNTNANENTNANLNTNADENTNLNANDNANINVPELTDEELDDDSDGLSNAEEKRLGTDPLAPDTDNDGLFDREEVMTYDTDPTSSDSDQDGLLDYEEINIYGTDPNNADSDGDGYSDFVEISNGYNPLGEGVLEQ